MSPAATLSHEPLASVCATHKVRLFHQKACQELWAVANALWARGFDLYGGFAAPREQA